MHTLPAKLLSQDPTDYASLVKNTCGWCDGRMNNSLKRYEKMGNMCDACNDRIRPGSAKYKSERATMSSRLRLLVK